MHEHCTIYHHKKYQCFKKVPGFIYLKQKIPLRKEIVFIQIKNGPNEN